MAIFMIKDLKKPACKIAKLEGNANESFETQVEFVDVSWALLAARTFHLIGACGSMGVFIYKFAIREQASNEWHFELLEKVTLISLNNNPMTFFKEKMEHNQPCRASWNYMVRLRRLTLGHDFDNFIFRQKNCSI